MKKYIPQDEEAQLRTLRSRNILDTSPEEYFDRSRDERFAENPLVVDEPNKQTVGHECMMTDGRTSLNLWVVIN